MRKSYRIPYIVLTLLAGATIFGCARSDKMDEWEHAKQQGFNDFRNSQLESSTQHYLKAVELARQIDPQDPRVGSTLNELARVFIARSDYQSALNAYSDAAACLQPALRSQQGNLDLARSYCEAAEGLAVCAAHLGDQKQADHFFQEALKTAQDAKIGNKVRDVTFEYADFLRESGDEERARVLSSRAERELQKVQALPQAGAEPVYGMDTHRQAAKTAEKQGDIGTAEHEFRQSVDQAGKLADKKLSAIAATELAQFYMRTKEPQKAENWFRYALDCYDSAGASIAEKRAAMGGLVLSLSKQHKEGAATVAEQLVKQCETINSPDQHELADALGLLAGTYLEQAKYEPARQAYSRLYDLYKEHEPLNGEHCALAMCYVANVYSLQGYKDKFANILNDYVAAVSRKPAVDSILPGRLLNDYGEVCLKGGYTEEAPGFLEAARTLLKRAPNSNVELARSDRLLKTLRNHG